MDDAEVKTLIVDTDALIALFNKDDSNFSKAKVLFESFYEQKTRLIYPSTALVETIDTIQRRLKKYEVAKQLAQLILSSDLTVESVEPINGNYLKAAVKYFEAEGSNRKTLADAVVVAVAKKLNADGIFSFDEWYQKLGYKLAAELV